MKQSAPCVSYTCSTITGNMADNKIAPVTQSSSGKISDIKGDLRSIRDKERRDQRLALQMSNRSVDAITSPFRPSFWLNLMALKLYRLRHPLKGLPRPSESGLEFAAGDQSDPAKKPDTKDKMEIGMVDEQIPGDKEQTDRVKVDTIGNAPGEVVSMEVLQEVGSGEGQQVKIDSMEAPTKKVDSVNVLQEDVGRGEATQVVFKTEETSSEQPEELDIDQGRVPSSPGKRSRAASKKPSVVSVKSKSPYTSKQPSRNQSKSAMSRPRSVSKVNQPDSPRGRSGVRKTKSQARSVSRKSKGRKKR